MISRRQNIKVVMETKNKEQITSSKIKEKWKVLKKYNLWQDMWCFMRSSQFLGQNQFHGSLQSISKVDKQHFSRQIFPTYPIWHYHDSGSYLRKKDPQRTAQFHPSVGLIHNEWVSYLNHSSDQDPLRISFKFRLYLHVDRKDNQQNSILYKHRQRSQSSTLSAEHFQN